jgi:hypothetical protein
VDVTINGFDASDIRHRVESAYNDTYNTPNARTVPYAVRLTDLARAHSPTYGNSIRDADYFLQRRDIQLWKCVRFGVCGLLHLDNYCRTGSDLRLIGLCWGGHLSVHARFAF